jgi:exopolyphosphatase / guanosine-5'-triphosphate,3'-diphosphate pyrophosphatase
VARKGKNVRNTSTPVAAVDVGSNSIKMTVARLRRGTLDVLAEESETVRLGAGLESTRTLAQDRIAAAIETLSRFAGIAREHGATRLLGVATEATRAATNGEVFLNRAREETGWDLRVISGDEEAGLTFRGLAVIGDMTGSVVVADIGGGSTELIAAESSAVAMFRSIPLGSGRLTDRLITHDPPVPAEIEACADAATGQLGAVPFPVSNPDQMILLGGTAEALARLVPDRDHISTTDLETALCRLIGEPAAQLAESTGIAEARARVLPAGVAIMRAMAQMLHPANMRLAASGIRTGLILTALDEASRIPVDPCAAMSGRIASLWEEVAATMPAAIAGEDPEGVHKMRVASRRLRAAMDIATPCFPTKWYRSLHRTARQVTRSAGAVRDREVLLLFLISERKKKLTPEMRAAIDYWSAELSVERELARVTMLDFLAEFGANDVLAKARRRFLARNSPSGKSCRKCRGKADVMLIDPERSWTDNASRVLEPRIHDLFSFGDAIADPEAIEAHHSARIAGKRLRYTLELFADVFGKPGTHALDDLTDLQDSLGKIHDTDVRIALIADEIKIQAEGHDPDLTIQAGLEQLAERFQRSRHREHATLARMWQRDAANFEQELIALIGESLDTASATP